MMGKTTEQNHGEFKHTEIFFYWINWCVEILRYFFNRRFCCRRLIWVPLAAEMNYSRSGAVTRILWSCRRLQEIWQSGRTSCVNLRNELQSYCFHSSDGKDFEKIRPYFYDYEIIGIMVSKISRHIEKDSFNWISTP